MVPSETSSMTPETENRIKMIGISGGSCSGKTTLSKMILDLLGKEVCNLLYQDNYYLDQSERFDKDRGAVNFDHPDAIDFALLSEHLETLSSGLTIQCPTYEFSTHKRLSKTIAVEPKKFSILDGTLILGQESIRKHMDYMIYVDAPEELRLKRRIQRDISERGRKKEEVINQFENQVRPMHDKFVEPSKVYANQVIHGVEKELTNFNKYFLNIFQL